MSDTPDCKALKDQRARLQAELKNLPVLPVDQIANLNRILGELEDTLKGTQDDLEKFKKEAQDKFKELEKQAPDLAKKLKDLLDKGKRVIGAAGKAGESVSEFTQVLGKYLEITKAAEEYYRKMEGSSSQQLDTFASYLDGLTSTLSSAPGSVGPVTIDPTAVKVMQQIMKGYADSVRATAAKVAELQKLQDQEAAALKEADTEHRDVLKRAKSERERLADRKQDLAAQIKALDDLIEKVCPEPDPYDPCSDPNNRVNRAVHKADADREVVALLTKRSAALTAYRNAVASVDAAWGNYITYSEYLNGDKPLDESTPDKPTVGLLFSGHYDGTNKAYGQKLRRLLDGYIKDADEALKDYQAKEPLTKSTLADLQAANTAYENARNNAIAKIAADEKWTAEDLEVLRRCHPEVKEPPRHAMRTPTGVFGRTGALVAAGVLVVAGVVTGVAVATGGGGGSNKTTTGVVTPTTGPRVATGGNLGHQLRDYMVGPPSKDIGVYWEGYAASATGCPSDITFGPSHTGGYAGTMWMTGDVLHASGIEFSGDYSGTLGSDGAFQLETAPYPQQPETVDAHIVGYQDGVYPIEGTFSDVQPYVDYGDCVITYTMTSGHLDTVP